MLLILKQLIFIQKDLNQNLQKIILKIQKLDLISVLMKIKKNLYN